MANGIQRMPRKTKYIIKQRGVTGQSSIRAYIRAYVKVTLDLSAQTLMILR